VTTFMDMIFNSQMCRKAESQND